MGLMTDRFRVDGGIGQAIDDLAFRAEVRSDCMFQMCMMLARVALNSGDEAYKQKVTQQLIAVLREKPSNNVVSLFPKAVRD